MQQIKLQLAEAEELQKTVDHHLDLCYLSIDLDPENMSDEEAILLDGFEPFDVFCGCQTCVTREIIMKTFEFLHYISKADIYVNED
jgi:hypothetical protein